MMAAAYPDIFSAVGVHSGLPAGGAQDIPQAFAAMRSGSKENGCKLLCRPSSFTVWPIARSTQTTARPLCHGLYTPCWACARPCDRAQRTAGTVIAPRHTITPMAQPCGTLAVEGAGHAWAGGHSAGSYTDPKGSDASRRMQRFFLQHAKDLAAIP